MNRRHFLRSSLQFSSLIAAHGLFPNIARALAAQAGEPRFLVMLPVFSGMDSTLGLDPWLRTPGEQTLFLGYRDNEVLRGGNLLLGPTAAPLLPHAQDICAINGIVMHDTNVDHGANFQYMTTGRGQGAPDIAVSASLSGIGARGVLSSTALNTGTMSVAFSDTNYMIQLARQSAGAGLLCRKPGQGDDPLSLARATACGSQSANDKLSRSFAELVAQKDRFGVQENELILAAAFLSGSAYQAKLVINPTAGTIDSHSAHLQNHIPAQTSVWTQVANLFKLFKGVEYGNGRSLFDLTTFIVMTDFSRTPALNPAGGKDHNPQCNSVLVAGRGVNGGHSIGKSTVVDASTSGTGSSVLWGLPIDYRTGQAIESREAAANGSAQFIVPENVIGSVLSLFLSAGDRIKLGFDEAQYPLIPGLIRGA